MKQEKKTAWQIKRCLQAIIKPYKWTVFCRSFCIPLGSSDTCHSTDGSLYYEFHK